MVWAEVTFLQSPRRKSTDTSYVGSRRSYSGEMKFFCVTLLCPVLLLLASATSLVFIPTLTAVFGFTCLASIFMLCGVWCCGCLEREYSLKNFVREVSINEDSELQYVLMQANDELERLPTKGRLCADVDCKTLFEGGWVRIRYFRWSILIALYISTIAGAVVSCPYAHISWFLSWILLVHLGVYGLLKKQTSVTRAKAALAILVLTSLLNVCSSLVCGYLHSVTVIASESQVPPEWGGTVIKPVNQGVVWGCTCDISPQFDFNLTAMGFAIHNLTCTVTKGKSKGKDGDYMSFRVGMRCCWKFQPIHCHSRTPDKSILVSIKNGRVIDPGTEFPWWSLVVGGCSVFGALCLFYVGVYHPFPPIRAGDIEQQEKVREEETNPLAK